jgi:hypothetical protein
MNVQLLQALIALQSVPTPDPQPESLEPKPPWEGDPIDIRECAEALRKAAGEYIGEAYAPTFHAPPRGRIVAQAKGPNRQQRRRR